MNPNHTVLLINGDFVEVYEDNQQALRRQSDLETQGFTCRIWTDVRIGAQASSLPKVPA